MDIDPAVLRAFVTVSEAGGFTRAAERLNLTQSAVSHQIRKLEEQVGCLLFARTTRRLDLTEDGKDLLPSARQMIDLLAQVERRFRPSPLAGIVRLGVPYSFIGLRLPPLLSRFARDYPQVRIEVSVSSYHELRCLVAAKQLDLAVSLSTTGDPAVPGDYRETVLRPTRFVWVAGETLSLRPGQPLPMVFATPPCVNQRVGIAALEDTRLDWRVAFVSASEEGLRAAVLAGLGIAVQPREGVVPGMCVVEGLHGLPPLPEAAFVMLSSGTEPTPAARALGRMILDRPDPDDDPASLPATEKSTPVLEERRSTPPDVRSTTQREVAAPAGRRASGRARRSSRES